MKWMALVAFSLMTLPAQAQETARFPARALAALCAHVPRATADDEIKAKDVCGAYFLGLTDALFVMQAMANRARPTCMPGDTSISPEEAKQAFDKYLNGHPQAADNSAGLVAAMALIYTYSCAK